MPHRVRPKGAARRTVAGARRTVAGRGAAKLVTLDDRPLALAPSHDGKRIIVTLPYEVWVVEAAGLQVERSIALTSPQPSAAEGESGVLWLGGQHLHRGALFGTGATKVGSKLGGFVDLVCPIRSRLLCGVGTHGEVLWSLEKDEVVHRRKASEHRVFGLIPTPDGRAIWAGGEEHVWVIDPDHPSGYTKLKLRHTSAVSVEAEGIVALGTTSNGGCVLAARDGAVGWTNRALRLVQERMPAAEGQRPPLGIASHGDFIYVLRPAGVLHRFYTGTLPPEDEADDDTPAPASTVRLRRLASCITALPDGKLVLAGPHADDQLGRLWREDPEALAWEPLALGTRRLVEAEANAEPPGPKPPNFTQTKTKVSGPPLSTIAVDDVLEGRPSFWVARASGPATERPVQRVPAPDVLGGDTLLLPAMVRTQKGTARPALLLWPGVADDAREPAAPTWLTWGDEPRGWMPLVTPQIRAQGWSRRDVFPLQIALPKPPPQVAGRRRPLPERWVDAELFEALGRECKKLLKVLW